MDKQNYDQIITIRKIINDVVKKMDFQINRDDLFQRIIKTWLQDTSYQKGIAYIIYRCFFTHDFSKEKQNKLSSIIMKSIDKYDKNNIYKRFENYLRTTNTWDLFIENCTNYTSTRTKDKFYCVSPINIILCKAFPWSETAQGYSFWSTLSQVWTRHCNKLLSPTQDMRELALQFILCRNITSSN